MRAQRTSKKKLRKWMNELRSETRQQASSLHTFYRANHHTTLQESQRRDQHEAWNGLGQTRGKTRQLYWTSQIVARAALHVCNAGMFSFNEHASTSRNHSHLPLRVTLVFHL